MNNKAQKGKSFESIKGLMCIVVAGAVATGAVVAMVEFAPERPTTALAGAFQRAVTGKPVPNVEQYLINGGVEPRHAERFPACMKRLGHIQYISKRARFRGVVSCMLDSPK